MQKLKSVWKEDNTFASFKDKPGVILEIQKIAGANEIEIVDRVYEALKRIQAISPNYEIRPFLDTTGYIRTSIEDVKFDLVLGAILAVLVVFAFLRNGTITPRFSDLYPYFYHGDFCAHPMDGLFIKHAHHGGFNVGDRDYH